MTIILKLLFMKRLILPLILFAFSFLQAQVQSPQPSPSATLIQTVGLTEFTVEYSRPSMRGREIFGELVPFGKLWRTGANKNSIIKFDDTIIFGGQEVKAGEYSIFTIPNQDEWEVLLYANTENWGTPAEWNEANIVASTNIKTSELADQVESFTIEFNHFTKNNAHLILKWENTAVNILVEVPTDEKVMASIEMAMEGTKMADYYNAAVYYLQTDRDIKKAKMWIDTAMDMREDKPFWMLRQQSLIYAKSGDTDGAIKMAKQSLEAAEKAGNADYVKMNKASLKEWGAK